MSQRAARVSPLEEDLDGFLRTFSRTILSRGRASFAQKRVRDLVVRGNLLRAVVQGSMSYDVSLTIHPSGVQMACTCPAFDRDGECKHAVAVAFAARAGDAAPASGLRPTAIPLTFAHAYSSSALLARLAIHAGAPLAPSADAWLPMKDWWRRASPTMRERVSALAVEVARDLDALRAWNPPEAPLSGTVFAGVYANLAARYRELRNGVSVTRLPPGPLDARHPGFLFAWDAARSVFEARERPSSLTSLAPRLAFSLPLASRTAPVFLEHAFAVFDGADGSVGSDSGYGLGGVPAEAWLWVEGP